MKLLPIHRYDSTTQLLMLKEICNKIYISRNISLSQSGVIEQLKIIDSLFRDDNENYDDELPIVELDGSFQKLKNSTWAKGFLAECPTQYKEALEYANTPNLNVYIDYNNREFVYSIIVGGTEFCLDAFEKKQKALDLIEEMGWNLVG